MIYAYRCEKCDHEFDVTKRAADMDVNEFCPSCEAPAVRQFVPSKVYFSGTKVQDAEYNPGLGQVVKSKYHRTELAKKLGLVEVGNDYKSGERMQTEFNTKREEKLKKRWDDV